jgi:hypothetical protein
MTVIYKTIKNYQVILDKISDFNQSHPYKKLPVCLITATIIT